jgi:hypothetical protein
VNSTWAQWVAAGGSIITPIVVIILGVYAGRVKATFERRLELEDKLREDRIAIYQEILDPFILLFTKDEAWKSDPKHKNMNKEPVMGQKHARWTTGDAASECP